MHLILPRVRYSACGPFTKNIEKIQKFKETGYLRDIYIYILHIYIYMYIYIYIFRLYSIVKRVLGR